MADVAITDKWTYSPGTSSGARTGIEGAVIYAVPDTTSRRFADSGGVYRVLGVNPGITTAIYNEGIRATTDANGQFTIYLPRLDASKPTTPSAQWTLIFPDGKQLVGSVPNVAGPLTVDDLISTYSWTWSSSVYIAPVTPGTLVRGTATFTAATSATIVFGVPFASAAYNIKLSASLDSGTGDIITPAWSAKTTTGFTITTPLFTGQVDWECVL